MLRFPSGADLTHLCLRRMPREGTGGRLQAIVAHTAVDRKRPEEAVIGPCPSCSRPRTRGQLGALPATTGDPTASPPAWSGSSSPSASITIPASMSTSAATETIRPTA